MDLKLTMSMVLYVCLQVVLSSDEEAFGGFRNITKDSDVTFYADQGNFDNRPHSMKVYAPSRTVVVYAPAKDCDKDADKKTWGVPGLGVNALGPYFAR